MLNNYEIYNNDCLIKLKDIPNESIDVILTDPPYQYLNVECDRYFDKDIFLDEAKRVLKKTGIIVLFGRGTSFYEWNVGLAERGFEFKEEIIWNKRQVTSPATVISRVHETISIYSKSKSTKLKRVKVPYIEMKEYDLYSLINDVKRIKTGLKNAKSLSDLEYYLENKRQRYGLGEAVKHKATIGEMKRGDKAVHALKSMEEGMREKSIIEIQREHFKMEHPFQKPVRLLERLINLTSEENEVVLDPFMGSGSTGVACLNTNRKFIGIELEEEYYNVAKRRLEDA